MTSYGGDVFYFIAVNYNNSKFSIKYIESVNDIKIDTKDKLNIIIVDNNSEEKELEDLEFYCKTCNNVVLIKNHCNVGYFSGLNIGLRTIKYSSKNTVIVGNNDLTFDDNFIFNVKKNYIINKLMVICPNVITKDGKHQNPHVINRISYFNRLKAKIYNQNYYVGQLFRIINQFLKRIFTKDSDNTEYDKRQFIRIGIGACYVLTKEFFKIFDTLDDRVFLWGEEALLANQVESVNGKVLYDPCIIVYHHESASVNKIESKDKYYMVKESYRVYSKYL